MSGFGQDYPDVEVGHPDDPEPLPEESQHHGHTRMAYRLARFQEHRLLFVKGIGWHYWDGARWAEDERTEAQNALYAVLRDALAQSIDDKTLRRDVTRCESATGVKGVLELASTLPRFRATISDLDADPFLLNTTNGTLDLRTDEIKPPDPANRLTKVTGCHYDPDAAGPRFHEFLEEILPDAEVREFVQRLFGLALVGRTIEHVLPIFTGSGRNGKSTLLNVVRAALGDYAIEAEPDLLIERDRAHPTGLMDLMGTRLAVCQESDEGKRLATATVKRLTGGDAIRARRMGKDYVQFDSSHTVILVTNHKPRVPGDDLALWRRLLVVPFDVVVPNPDPNLPEALDLERAAVLAWAVEGYRQYRANRLQPPEAVTIATDSYRAESDVIGRFLEERTMRISTQAAGTKSSDLFAAWKSWCMTNGENAGNTTQFSQHLERMNYVKKRGNHGITWLGIDLLNTESDGLGILP